MRRPALFIVFFLALSSITAVHAENRSIDLERLSRDLLARSRTAREFALRLAERHGWPIREITADGSVYELQEISAGMPQYYTTCNADAAVSTRTDLVHPYTGGASGFVIGIWDGGKVRGTHQELIGRVDWLDYYNTSLSDHATHVAGTLIASGVRAQANGMAYQAGLHAHEWSDDEAEIAAEAADGLLISNHSYSYIRGWYENTGIFNPGWYWYGDSTVSETEDYHFGFYDSFTVEYDEIAAAAPYYLIVCAASNDRGENVPAPGTEHYYYHYGDSVWRKSTKVRDPDGGLDGYDCIPNGRQVAKNTLTVGAVHDVPVYTGPGDVVMTIFSSWGPTDDGRIKPDLVGNGYDLYSCIAADDTSYVGDAKGTSMASPNVCGSLALLQHYYQSEHGGTAMLAATLKALAIHTTREAGPADGPDYMFGWGLLDAYAAYQLIEDDLDDSKGLIEQLTLTDDLPIEICYWCDGTAPELRATICWSDPPGVPPPKGLNPPNIMLVNDLDLRILEGETEQEPWILDPSWPANPATHGDNFRDNVEQVVVDTPSEGLYIVRIDHKSTLDGGMQDVSLIVSGAAKVTTWHVYEDGSGDAPDIGSAVSSASEGDLIYVHSGTYNEHDITVNKQLLIKGLDGPLGTIVDAQSLGRCFSLTSNCGATTIEGFTLRNGLTSGAVRGAGLSCQSGDATIRDCRIHDCESGYAGALHCSYASPSIENCRLYGNTASNYGGAVYLYFSSPTFDHCLFTENSAAESGGGISCYESSPVLVNCTISHNAAAEHGGGIYVGYDSHPEIINTIVSFSTDGEGIYGPASAIPSLTAACCDVYGNADGGYGGSIGDKTGIDGNISEDPLYCDAAGSNYGLQGMSPCLPGGNSCGVYMGSLGQACHSKTLWYVKADGSGDAPTIQAAVDSTVSGDTVLIAPGTYTGAGNRDVSFDYKSILVTSESGPAATIIDVEDEVASGFLIHFGEDSTSVIEGLWIKRAGHGGIRLLGWSHPTIRNCWITNCNNLYGGGIYMQYCNSTISDCVISSNNAEYCGGGIAAFGFEQCSPRIEGCTITSNTAALSGAGIYVRNDVQFTITGTHISDNSSLGELGGGVAVLDSAAVTIDGCSINYNTVPGDGGGVYGGPDADVTLSNTIMYGDTAYNCGGGVYAYKADIVNCTIVSNHSPDTVSGVFLNSLDECSVTRSILAFNEGVGCGILASGDAGNIQCCDVYGNTDGNYGGIPDQTGVNDNISDDPLFCELPALDLYIHDASPCAPDHSTCGQLIGALGVNCYIAPDLVIESAEFSTTSPRAKRSITATVKVKNLGVSAADSFYIDFYPNRTSPPGPGATGEQRLRVDGLAVGDSILWTTDPVSSDFMTVWRSYFRVDADNYIIECNEGNNVHGPTTITWKAPPEPGWPLAGSGDFHSSPALADIDGDPRTLEVIVGCDGGMLYAWTSSGDTVCGSWPVDLGAPIESSPAVGDITGDYRPEVVVGCNDGKLYAYDNEGGKLWDYTIGQPVVTTPALADIDGDGKLEIVASGLDGSSNPKLYVLTGSGTDYAGSWPVSLGGTGVTSPAAGDVDDDGSVEIAVAASGFTKPVAHSRVFLYDDSGASYSGDWPVQIDTVITASPVMGDIAGGGSHLEIVVGGTNGVVYAINLSGAIWPSLPRVPGVIERSPALVYTEKSGCQQIAVCSRYWQETIPPFGNWYAAVTVISNEGAIVSGWPRSGGLWSNDYGPVPAPINLSDVVMAGTPYRRVYCWETMSGSAAQAFPIEANRRFLSSPAAGDIDGDGWIELVAAGSPDSLYCYELCSSAYEPGELWWPMFRNGRTRTGCYYVEEVTGVEDEPEEMTPAVTRLRSIYPNPFNPVTRIRFDLGGKAMVDVSVYDVTGRRIKLLERKVMEAGRHEILWNGVTDGGWIASSGVYFCRFEAGNVIQTRKMVLLR